jgi:two-component system phosphate regulon sensor histidine kinase PhoR
VVNHGDIITEQEIEQIFQPFFRGSNAEDNKGFGLGLSYVKTVVDAHRGKISLRSEVGKGSIFRIYLPALR